MLGSWEDHSSIILVTMDDFAKNRVSKKSTHTKNDITSVLLHGF